MHQQVETSANGHAATIEDPPRAGHRTVVMALIGEFDISSRDRLNAALERLNDVDNVILDLTEVRYLDSTAIGEFIHLHKVRKAKDLQRETIVIPNDALRRIFDILRLAEIFELTDRLQDAVPQGNGLVDLDFVAEIPGINMSS
jgi:anti-sigma B factor antagonist